MISVGDLYIQRPSIINRPYHRCVERSDAIFWTCVEVNEPRYTFSNGKDTMICRKLQTDPAYCIRIHRNYCLEGYMEYLESPKLFRLPLQDYNSAKRWMQQLHDRMCCPIDKDILISTFCV